ncbi:hypothetical protein EDC01DRAFT_629826 [Geopyxis carbonaria]|nr:hypothetical protein EDC01DRAFT_629826 [Geopyxis carbonaria]
MSETVVQKDEKQKQKHHGLPEEHSEADICGSGSLIKKSFGHSDDVHINESPTSVDSARLHGVTSDEHLRPNYTTPPRIQKLETHNKPRREPHWQSKTDEPPQDSHRRFAYSLNFPTSEESVKALVSKLNDHDHLIRFLEKEIGKKVSLLPLNTREKPRLKELDVLYGIYVRTLKFYYDPRIARKMMEPAEDEARESHPMSSYTPPFPKHISSDPPTLLNKALMDLFSAQPFPRFLLLKISYNLLISPSPPNVTTYNILVHGFTALRQNALAHMVFQNMIDRGIAPDDYSIVGFFNLCIKSGDYESFIRLVQIVHKGPSMGGAFHFMPKRGQIVLETMLHGAARFGRIKRVKGYLRSLRQEFPDAPGLITLTSILKLWSDTKDWNAGLQVWEDIKEPDLRAYHQMAQLCIECNKPERLAHILEEANAKGWSEEQVLGPPPRTKTLFTRPMKTLIPRLAEISPIYPHKKQSYQWYGKSPPIGNWQHFMNTMEDIFDSDMIYHLNPDYPGYQEDTDDNLSGNHPENPAEVPQKNNDELHFMNAMEKMFDSDMIYPSNPNDPGYQKDTSDDPSGNHPENPAEAPQKNKDELVLSRSDIWHEILARRTEILESETIADPDDI